MVKLYDFGIARALGVDELARTQIDDVVSYLFGLIVQVSVLDFSPDIPRNRTMA
jgi:hypothetical protein